MNPKDLDHLNFEKFLRDYVPNGGDDVPPLLEGMRLRAQAMTEEERLSPDTFGCDALCIRGLIDEKLLDDFDLIARDFVAYEFEHLSEYADVKYVNDDPGINSPREAMRYYYLNLMMCAARKGSEFAIAQFCHIYKTYYRHEYNRLKRFSSISGSEVLNLAEDADRYDFENTLARYLSMARMFGIEIEPSCSYIYLALTDMNERMQDIEKIEFPEIDQDLHASAVQLVEEFYPDNRTLWRAYADANEFIGKVLAGEGFIPDYVELADHSNPGLRWEFERAARLYMEQYPGAELQRDILPLYAAILQSTTVLCYTTMENQDSWRYILRTEETDFYEHFPAAYRPEKVVPVSRQMPIKTKASAKSAANTESDAGDENRILHNQIELLQMKLHTLEKENRQLAKTVSDTEKRLSVQSAEMEVYRQERVELAALREHVYHLTEQDLAEETVDITSMKSAICNRRIMIIGGNDNWVKKLRAEFPHWTYIGAEVSGSADINAIRNAEIVYFFTDTMGHSTYYRYLQALRQADTPFKYIHGVNIKGNIVQIYHDLEAENMR